MRLTKFLRGMYAIPILASVLFITGYAFADNSVVSPGDFLAQVLQYVQSFGGLSWVLKLSGMLTLAIAMLKVSFLNDLIWSKLGNFKAWAAPVLGITAGIVSMLASGQPVTFAAVLAYFAAGAGAIILHELLDTIKAIPGLGAVWVSLINAIQKALGGPSNIVQVPGR